MCAEWRTSPVESSRFQGLDDDPRSEAQSQHPSREHPCQSDATNRVTTHIRTRAVSLIALVATIGLGLWSRSPSFPGTPFVAQQLGTLLWAVALHWTIRTLMPRWPVLRVSALTLLIA